MALKRLHSSSTCTCMYVHIDLYLQRQVVVITLVSDTNLILYNPTRGYIKMRETDMDLFQLVVVNSYGNQEVQKLRDNDQTLKLSSKTSLYTVKNGSLL